MDAKRQEWAPLVLRIVFGIGFVFHGYPKLFGGHEGVVGMLTNLGIPLPGLMAWIVGIVEFFGGILLIVGAFVTIVSTLCLIDMLVALFVVHLGNGFYVSNQPPGIELPFLYAGAFLALVISGAGMLSVDRAMREDREREPTTRESGAAVYEDRPRST